MPCAGRIAVLLMLGLAVLACESEKPRDELEMECTPSVVTSDRFPNVPYFLGGTGRYGERLDVGCPSVDGGSSVYVPDVRHAQDAAPGTTCPLIGLLDGGILNWRAGDRPSLNECRFLCGIACGCNVNTCSPEDWGPELLECHIADNAQAVPPTCAPNRVVCTGRQEVMCYL